MIIGAQKAGTTTLYNWLSKHPDIVLPKYKELHFFDSFDEINFNHYHKNFPLKSIFKKLSFEATPRYLYFPKTPQKIYNYNKNMKFIIILRNPAYRAFSAYKMYERFKLNASLVRKFEEIENRDKNQIIYSFFYKNEFPSFKECVNAELELMEKKIIEPSIVRRGHYKEQIENYFKYFKREQFLFLEIDQMKDSPQEILKESLEFLNLRYEEKYFQFLQHENVGSYQMSDEEKETMTKLKLYYESNNSGLEDLIRKKISWQ